MIPCKERHALNGRRHPDGYTARRGITLIFAGVTAVMVLAVSLFSVYFTPASAGAISAAFKQV